MKIAVIGAGVSGLGAALALCERHDVRLFEKDHRFGGHANTAEISYDGAKMAVDTGFIVYNHKNYPNLTKFFDHLEVPTQDSDMSFAVSLDDGKLEYACDNLDKIFAQRWRALDPSFIRCFIDILRFHKIGARELNSGVVNGVSLGDWLKAKGFSKMAQDSFMLAMGGAIWSTPQRAMEDFPARAFLQFFVNHELLNGLEKGIQWRTVKGGSREYVQRALAKLGPRAQAGVGALAATRLDCGRVRVAFSDGSEAEFDQVVMACHSDQALALLQDADAAERSLLGAVKYSSNRAVLHRDPALMPKLRKTWSSWNFLAQTNAEDRPAAVSYWMNRLQGLDASKPLFVTLNPPQEPAPELTFAEYSYAHPLYDQAAFDAQEQFDAIQGARSIWFAGAYLGWGFHEDGLKAGLRVAEALGARPSWAANVGAPLRPSLATAAE